MWETLWKHRLGIIGGGLFLIFVFMAIFAPWITPEDYHEIDLDERHAKPFWMDSEKGVGLLGTDGIGRDIASGIVLGARISMFIGISVTISEPDPGHGARAGGGLLRRVGRRRDNADLRHERGAAPTRSAAGSHGLPGPERTERHHLLRNHRRPVGRDA